MYVLHLDLDSSARLLSRSRFGFLVGNNTHLVAEACPRDCPRSHAGSNPEADLLLLLLLLRWRGVDGVVVANARAVVVVHVRRLNVVREVVVVVMVMGREGEGSRGWLGMGCGEAAFTEHCRGRGYCYRRCSRRRRWGCGGSVASNLSSRS